MLVKLNNAEFEVDFLDYDVARHFEDECDKVKEEALRFDEKMKRSPNITHSQVIYETTMLVHGFFDKVLGEGASKKIFGERINLGQALRTFAELVEYKNNSPSEFKEMAENFAGQNTANAETTGNRQQRRAQQKGKGKNKGNGNRNRNHNNGKTQNPNNRNH